MVTSISVDEGHNRHIVEYLNAYVSGETAPKYAVLLNGEWGSGKTYLVEQLVPELKSVHRDLHVVKVSLYGLENEAQIEHKLLSQLHPLYSACRTLLAALFKRTQVDLDPAKFAQRFVADLYIFDDLERCRAPIDVTMGYINRFVEQGDRKIIVIANEDEIGDRARYDLTKEKLIGKTFKVQTSVAQVFDYFLAAMTSETAKHIQTVRVEILSVQEDSESRNLRVMRQTLWDFERVLSVLSPKYLSSKDALAALAQSYFALSLELKEARLQNDDLALRSTASAKIAVRSVVRSTAEEADASTVRWQAFSRRHVRADLGIEILPDNVWHSILVEGRIEREAILTALDSSEYFSDKRNWPSWKAMWSLYDFTDDEVDYHVPRFEEDFRSRRFLHAGEIVHMCGAKAHLHQLGLDSREASKVVNDCKSYIDDAVANPSFDPLLAAEFTTGRFSYDHKGYSLENFPVLAEAVGYFEQRRLLEVDRRSPAWASAILQTLASDPVAVAQNLCGTKFGALGDVPLLHHIDPSEFAEKVAALTSDGQRYLFEGLTERYRRVTRENLLGHERPWLIRLHGELARVANTQSTLNKYRLLERVERSFVQWLT